MLTLFMLAVLAAPGDSLVYDGRAGDLQVSTPKLDAPAMTVDGRLDEPAWDEAAVLAGFTQYEPVEGAPASAPTEVRVFYTDRAIHFGIRAVDREPDRIRAAMTERDRSVFDNDWVRIMLDTFDDQRQAYIFYVNPLGIQTDGLWIEGMQRERGPPIPIDFNPDFIWTSDGRVTDEGWVAEIRIPYLSLRFRDQAVQNWGINIAREVKRHGYKQSWAPITRDQASTLSQSGRLVGLRDLRPRRLVEMNPVATGKRTGRRLEDGSFAYDDVSPQFGMSATLGLTQNLILDATVNPDFSQVEADADQIAVNERFALFYPEKRPFFLEGTEVFQTPQRLVHTRRIADPLAGAKLTGKVGAFNVGYLGAFDESPITLGGEDAGAAFNLLRVRRDIGTGSTVGALYTDRTRVGATGFNRVIGADARLLFRDRYTFTTQLATSWTQTMDRPDSVRTAPLVFASLSRAGRTFGWEVRFEDIAPEFRSRSGFLRRIGDARLFASTELMFYGDPGDLVEQWGTAVRADSYFDHAALWSGAAPEEVELELQPTIGLRGDHWIRMVLRDGHFRFDPDDYGHYRVRTETGALQPFQTPAPLDHMLGVAAMPRLQISQGFRLNGHFFYREVPLYREAARGLELQLGPEVQLQPTDRLAVELSYTRSRMIRRRDGSDYSSADIARLRTQYHFTRALSTRAVVQYNHQYRDALRDPATERRLWVGGRAAEATDTREATGQLLLAYEPSPGTVLFLGWNRYLHGDASVPMRRASDGLFAKFSYLFRM